MTVKTSISLTDQLHAEAMKLVESGAYPHLSAVIQQALRGLISEQDQQAARLKSLKSDLRKRKNGRFLEADDFTAATDAMFADLISHKRKR